MYKIFIEMYHNKTTYSSAWACVDLELHQMYLYLVYLYLGNLSLFPVILVHFGESFPPTYFPLSWIVPLSWFIFPKNSPTHFVTFFCLKIRVLENPFTWQFPLFFWEDCQLIAEKNIGQIFRIPLGLHNCMNVRKDCHISLLFSVFQTQINDIWKPAFCNIFKKKMIKMISTTDSVVKKHII